MIFTVAGEMIHMKRRRGMALLTVVLLAALVLAAVAVTSSQVIAEKSIDTSEWGFKKALSVAETGLAVTEADLRSAILTGSTWTIATPDGRDTYLKQADIAAIATAANTTVLDTVGPAAYYKSFPDSRSRYRIKVKMLSAGSASGSMRIGLYALGEVYAGDAAQSGAVLLGRRVLYEEATVTFINNPTSTNAAFNYGLFSGDGINFGSSANPQVLNGSIYARGIIDLGSKPRVPNGTVYCGAGGSVKGNSGADTVVPAVKGTALDIPFPQLDIAFYDQMANDFKAGQGAFGSSATGGYPNTVPYKTILQETKYLSPSGTPSTLGGVALLYQDLSNNSGDWKDVAGRTDLLSKLKYAVYHVVYDGSTITNFTTLGAVMITGPNVGGQWTTTTVKFSGQTQVTDPGGLALLIDGGITVSGGGNVDPNVNGLLYMTGTLDAGTGHFSVKGAVVSGGTMGPLNGDFQVDYQAIANMPNMSIVGGTTTSSLAGVAGTWVEKDLAKFNNPS